MYKYKVVIIVNHYGLQCHKAIYVRISTDAKERLTKFWKEKSPDRDLPKSKMTKKMKLLKCNSTI